MRNHHLFQTGGKEGSLSIEMTSWFYGLVSTAVVVALAFAGWVAVSILAIQQNVAAMKIQLPMERRVLTERFKRLDQKLEELAVQQARLQRLLEEHKDDAKTLFD